MQTTTSRLTSGTQTVRLDQVRETDVIVTGSEGRRRTRPVTAIERHDGKITVRYGAGSTVGQPDFRIDIREREIHPDAGNPYEQIFACELRDTDVFASGLAVRHIDHEQQGLIVIATLADGTAHRYGANNPVLIKRRPTADEQQAKLERTLLAALVKRDAWQMGQITEPGYVYANLRQGDYWAMVGNHRGGNWWWEIFFHGQYQASGKVPAGPTANMRAAEQAIVEHQRRNGGA
jgi:hypothetical protein